VVKLSAAPFVHSHTNTFLHVECELLLTNTFLHVECELLLTDTFLHVECELLLTLNMQEGICVRMNKRCS